MNRNTCKQRISEITWLESIGIAQTSSNTLCWDENVEVSKGGDARKAGLLSWTNHFKMYIANVGPRPRFKSSDTPMECGPPKERENRKVVHCVKIKECYCHHVTIMRLGTASICFFQNLGPKQHSSETSLHIILIDSSRLYHLQCIEIAGKAETPAPSDNSIQ